MREDNQRNYSHKLLLQLSWFPRSMEGCEPGVARGQDVLNKPTSYKVKPKEDEDFIKPYLEIARLGQHILSRREILKYITSEAGKRAKEIQGLLDFMDIENLRATFVSIKNEAITEFNIKE